MGIEPISLYIVIRGILVSLVQHMCLLIKININWKGSSFRHIYIVAEGGPRINQRVQVFKNQTGFFFFGVPSFFFFLASGSPHP